MKHGIRGLRRSGGVVIWSAGLVAGLVVAGCEALRQVPQLFDDRTPRQRYEESLARAGLTGTALVDDWLAAAERALHGAPLVSSPHQEEGYLPPSEPAALAFRVSARRGQEIGFDIRLVGDTSSLLFLEAWRIEDATKLAFEAVAVADSGSRSLTFEPRRDGDFVLRAQPELLRGGRFTVSLRVGPTLAFPVRGGRERDVGSTFGDPRDGGARSHHGIDIFAPRGTPAIAAAEAWVRRVGTSPRGGNVVWLRDARGYSLYYAHLDRHSVTERTWVSPGDTIGFVGNSGNARTTPPHLHFGVYRRGEGPLNPWWFVHRPGGEIPPLVADTALLGRWARTPGDGVRLRSAPHRRADALGALPRHTVMRVLTAVGEWYRVRLPDGNTGYLAARLLEPAQQPVRIAGPGTGPLVAQPGPAAAPGSVLAHVTSGDSVDVLGRFGEYLLVRTADGLAGWVSR